AQICMGHQRAIRLPSHETVLAPCDNQQAAIWKPIDAKREFKRSPEHDLAAAASIDSEDLSSPPVGQPETIVVPARRFTHRHPGQQSCRFWRERLLKRHRTSLNDKDRKSTRLNSSHE